MGQCFFWFKRRRSDGTNDGTVKNILIIIVLFQYVIRKVDGHPIRHFRIHQKLFSYKKCLAVSVKTTKIPRYSRRSNNLHFSLVHRRAVVAIFA